MKSKTFILLFWAFSSFELFSEEIVQRDDAQKTHPVTQRPVVVLELNRVTIDAQKRTIREYLKQNAKMRTVVRAGMITVVTASVGYCLYRTFAPTTIVPVSAPQATVEVGQRAFGAIIANQREQEVAIRALTKALEGKGVAIKQAATDLAYLEMIAQKGKDTVSWSYHIMRDVGLFFINNLPSTVASCFVNMLILRDIPTVAEAGHKYLVLPLRRLNHPVNLEWFLVSQMKYKRIRWKEQHHDGSEIDKEKLDSEDLFKNLARTVYVLPLASDDFERGHYTATIINDLNVIMRKMARILAFCEVKAERVTAHNKTCGKYLKDGADFMFVLTKKFAKELGELLPEKSNHAKIQEVIAEFRFKLDEEFKSFRMYEAYYEYDITPR